MCVSVRDEKIEKGLTERMSHGAANPNSFFLMILVYIGALVPSLVLPSSSPENASPHRERLWP